MEKLISHLDDYKTLYVFLREKLNLQQTKILKDSLKKVLLSEEENLMDELTNIADICFLGIREINLRHKAITSWILYYFIQKQVYELKDIEKDFSQEVSNIVQGLDKVNRLSININTIESDNYLKLLLSMAEDIRVVFLVLIQQLQLMRNAKNMDKETRLQLSVESTYLYAPLAHRLGIYTVKSELEDLSLKYTDRERYDFIAKKLNETKKSRDSYIEQFIEPLKRRLDRIGLKYTLKGRTKSIHSINNKLVKQKIDFENIYDLFAIRIILDAPVEEEKSQCWQVYSVVTDMYQPNPKRLKDWLSVPKSNGYESLHITVMGPQLKWVEVQIRTQRMDEIAEKGFAAHWKYKGVKGEASLDNWMASLRETLENSNLNLQDKLGDFKLNLYDEEIFVFTPKGDLIKLPKGATILDFAFSIHSGIGSKCVSGKVNGKNVTIKYQLNSGDVVEIQTSPNQTPKQDWLSFVITAKARNKIRQLLKEESSKQTQMAKEMLQRRMKNRKIEVDEAVLMPLIKKLKYKSVTDFYIDIANEKLDINSFIDKYLEAENKEIITTNEIIQTHSAENYIAPDKADVEYVKNELILDKNTTGIEFKLAKCCNPIYGDDIFGFVSSHGIKIHRTNCPNASDMFSRFGYRIIKARWAGEKSSEGKYIIVLRVIGNDQMSVVSNLMSIIEKENGVQLRSVSVDSNDGLFQGNISVMLGDTKTLDKLIKKMKSAKGVKSIERLN